MRCRCRPGWGQAVEGFERYLRAASRSAQTIRLRTYWVCRFASDSQLSDPFGVRMDDLLSWLAHETWSAETRKSARASVVAFYRWAVDTDRIAEQANPARKLPRVSPGRKLPRPTPDNVLRDALWQATDRDRLMLMLAGYGGLRRAEVARVHPDDFFWEDGHLMVRGKGRRERLVPIHPDLAFAVRAELARRAQGTHGSGYRYDSDIRPDGYLFPGKHGHVTPDTVGRVLDRLLAGKWTGHTLRHRFGTKAYANDRDLRAVQILLGHANMETTVIYTQVPDESLRTAVLAVGLDAA